MGSQLFHEEQEMRLSQTKRVQRTGISGRAAFGLTSVFAGDRMINNDWKLL